MKHYLKAFLIDTFFWIRWGNITTEVKATDGGQVSELEIKDRFGRVICYWAYGSFDPNLPYRGQWDIY